MYCTGTVMHADEVERIIRLLASAVNSEINDRHPSLSAKLPEWGARVQASVPPIVASPVFSLRMPAQLVYSLDDYVATGILEEDDASVLRNAVRERKNILVGGGTGSGKTTFVNALLKEVAETGDRIYIVEDNSELQCDAENKLEVLVQPPVYTHQRAIMDALRFRPDRIIVGEVRDGAALEMLKAWNTGHPAGLPPSMPIARSRCLIAFASCVKKPCPTRPAISSRKRLISVFISVAMQIILPDVQ